MMNDEQPVVVHEETILEKFEGDPKPENLIERIYIKDGEIVSVEKIGGNNATN